MDSVVPLGVLCVKISILTWLLANESSLVLSAQLALNVILALVLYLTYTFNYRFNCGIKCSHIQELQNENVVLSKQN